MDTIKIINPYDDYQSTPMESADGAAGNSLLGRVQSLQVGFGSKVLRIDRQGLWMGAEDFPSAPFSVDMDGNMTALSLDLSGYLQVGEALSDIGAGNITGTYIANGTITTAKLVAGEITGFTVTGGTVRTSSSGKRVQMTSTYNRLDVYDTSVRRMSLDSDSLEFYNSSGTLTASMSSEGGFSLLIDGSGSAYTVMRFNALYGLAVQSGTTAVSLFYNGGMAMQNNAVIRCYDIEANSGADCGTTAQPFTDGNFEGILTVGNDIQLYDNLYMDNTSAQTIYMNDGNIRLSDDGGEFIDVNQSSNDLRLWAMDQIEFYPGGSITAIIDSNIWTGGDIYADGTKYFIIPHPDGSDRMLRYTAHEGDEVLVRTRGVVVTGADGRATIRPPAHYTLVVDKGSTVTVQLTTVHKATAWLEQTPTAEEVYIATDIPNIEVHYEIMAVRDGYLNHPVELDANDARTKQIFEKRRAIVLKNELARTKVQEMKDASIARKKQLEDKLKK